MQPFLMSVDPTDRNCTHFRAPVGGLPRAAGLVILESRSCASHSPSEELGTQARLALHLSPGLFLDRMSRAGKVG